LSFVGQASIFEAPQGLIAEIFEKAGLIAWLDSDVES
jgi:hypothetical protein